MRAGLEKLTLQTLASFSDAEVLLRKIPNDDPVSFVDFVSVRLRSGEYQAKEIFYGNDKIGIQVYYIESFPNHRELVSVATYTNKNAPDFSTFWKAEMVRLACSLSCKSIRFSTVRAGLAKLALDDGWQLCEVTFRKYL